MDYVHAQIGGFVYIGAMAEAVTGQLALTDLWALGPLAALVFLLFEREIVVSGRAHKRERTENARLRNVIETALPLVSESMVTATTKNADALDRVHKTLTEVASLLESAKTPPGSPPQKD